jgi:hypothetical protein
MRPLFGSYPGRPFTQSILHPNFFLDKPIVLGYGGLVAMKLKCKVHGIPLVCYCPACRGSARSKHKAESSRANGKLGGRPKGKRKVETKAR